MAYKKPKNWDKQAEEWKGQDAAKGNYPGKVDTPFTIGKAAPPGLAGTYKNEQDYQTKAIEARKQAQLALLASAEANPPPQAIPSQPTQNISAELPTQPTQTDATQQIPTEEQVIANLKSDEPMSQEEIQRQGNRFNEVQRRRGLIPKALDAAHPFQAAQTQLEIAKGLLPELIISWDAVKTAFSRKKPLKYANAVEGFDARIKIIDTAVTNARAGQPYYDAEKDLKAALNDFNRILESTKGIGKANANWQIDDGLSIQEEILNKLDQLKNLQTDLEYIKAAQRNSQINEMRKAYGL